MKVFGFTNNAGYIGGSGVVIADTLEDALQMVNDIGDKEPMKFQIEYIDLVEIQPNTVHILTNGDY